MNVLRVEDLIEEAHSVYRPNSNYIFMSFDVVSMFDNIEMREILRILPHLSNKCPNGYVNMDALHSLIELESKMFSYMRYQSCISPMVDEYYQQLSGIPMGGNTSSHYADLFMTFRLSSCMKKFQELGVLLLRKYVDDLLLYVPHDKVSAVLTVLKCATGLDFTSELPVSGVLNYLDVSFLDIGTSLRTRWFRKPYSSPRLVHYLSNVPLRTLLFTYANRFVRGSLNDSGGGILETYLYFLQELKHNQVPIRFWRSSIRIALRYDLGRNSKIKRFWLWQIFRHCYALSDVVSMDIEDFYRRLVLLSELSPRALSIFFPRDVISSEAYVYVRVARPSFRAFNEGTLKLPYRGKHSEPFYKLVRKRYKGIPIVFYHDPAYSLRRFYQRKGKHVRVSGMKPYVF